MVATRRIRTIFETKGMPVLCLATTHPTDWIHRDSVGTSESALVTAQNIG